MKRLNIVVVSCICALALSLFGLCACGDSSSSSNNGSGSSSSSQQQSGSSDETVDPDNADASNMSQDEIRSVFEAAIAGMSEYYKGTTPVGEQIYYAGGQDGDNAILVLIVPESNQSAIFIGPATVGDDNRLTVTDETTGSAITFDVTQNDDDTYSFTLGEEYGSAIMTICSSNEIIDKLTEVVLATSDQAASGDAVTEGQTAEPEGSQE